MNKIKLANILKLPCDNYFGNNLDKQIQLKMKIVLINALLHKSTESLLLINCNTYRYLITTNNNPDEVSFSTKMLEKLRDTQDNNLYIAIHNHPYDNTFSLDDLTQLMRYRKLKAVMLITNTCRYSAGLLKENLTINERKQIIDDIEQYKKEYNVDGHASALDIIQKFGVNKLKYVYYNHLEQKEEHKND